MKKILALCLLAVMLCLAGCAQKETLPLEMLDSSFAVDIKQYAKDEGVDYSDIEECASVWTFRKDGTLSVSLVTACAAVEELAEATESATETTYTVSEKIECVLSEEAVYTVSGDTLLWEHGIVMGSIKSNKTSKGTTTIKLDTPNGGSKTLKGTLSEDGVTFTVNSADNKLSAVYTLNGDALTAEKGVVLGTITARQTEGDNITLTVKAPDGTQIEFVGAYAPELKIGSVVYSYEYSGDTLVLYNTKHRLVLNKQG